MTRVAGLLPLAFGLLLSACASGPEFAEMQQGLSAPEPDQGRVYFYRTQVVGAAVQPAIYLNADKVGDCVPNGVFFKDLTPGKYEASVETEVERTLSFVLDAGEEKYVRCYISIGVFVGHGNVELVDPVEAKAEIGGLAYTGS